MDTTPTIALEKTPTGKYIMRWDASLLNEANCRRKIYYKLIRGLTGQDGAKDFKMEYGTAFHKAMFVHYSGGSIEAATQAAFTHYSQPTIYIPDSDWRTLGHLLNCVMQYIGHWKRQGDLLRPATGNDGKPMLEKSFQFPFYSTPLVDVLLCGTIDMVGYFNTIDTITDHKTTSLIQKESYLNGYQLSAQLMTYKMIYQELFPGKDVACMINGIFLNRSNNNSFQRSPLFHFSPLQIANHRRWIKQTISTHVEMFERDIERRGGLDDTFPTNYTCCKEEYGMCEFAPVCAAPTMEDSEGIVLTGYGKRIYDPSKFQA